MNNIVSWKVSVYPDSASNLCFSAASPANQQHPRSTTQCLIAEPQRQQLSRGNSFSLNPPQDPLSNSHLAVRRAWFLSYPSNSNLSTSTNASSRLFQFLFPQSFERNLQPQTKMGIYWERKITKNFKDYWTLALN